MSDSHGDCDGADFWLDSGRMANIRGEYLVFHCEYCKKDISFFLNKFWRKAIEKSRIQINEHI